MSHGKSRKRWLLRHVVGLLPNRSLLPLNRGKIGAKETYYIENGDPTASSLEWLLRRKKSVFVDGLQVSSASNLGLF
jgi:hypothetical protein